MVVHAGALEAFAAGQLVTTGKRVAPELPVMRRALAPGATPVGGAAKAAGELLEICQHHAGGYEARRPVGDGSLEPGVGRHARPVSARAGIRPRAPRASACSTPARATRRSAVAAASRVCADAAGRL